MNCDCCRLPQLHTAVWTIHPRMEESSIGRETGQAADSSITATLAIGSWVTETPHADSIPMGFTSGTIQLHYAKVIHTIQRYSLTQSSHSNVWELPWKGNLPPRIWQNVSFCGALKAPPHASTRSRFYSIKHFRRGLCNEITSVLCPNVIMGDSSVTPRLRQKCNWMRLMCHGFS